MKQRTTWAFSGRFESLSLHFDQRSREPSTVPSELPWRCRPLFLLPLFKNCRDHGRRRRGGGRLWKRKWGLGGVSRPGTGNKTASSQPGKQDSLTQEHCSLVRQQTQVWWAQRHSLPLPVSDPFQIKGRHTQLWGPKSQVKKTQAVSQIPLSLPPLRSLSVYSPGCPGCLEHSSRESCTLVQLLFHLLTNLSPFPLFSLKPSVSCHRR